MGKVIDIATKREKLISDSIAELTSSIPEVQTEIWKKINKFLQGLETDKDGKLKTTTANLKAIQKFVNTDIKAIIRNSNYPQQVKGFVSTFKVAGDLTNRYFDELDA